MTVSRSSHRLLVLSLCLVLLAGIPATSLASPIPVTSFDGTIGSFNITSSGATATLSDAGVSATIINGSALGTPISGTLSSVTITTTPVSGPSGYTTYNATNGTMTLTDNTNTVNFNITGLQLSVPNNTFSNDILLNGSISQTGSPTTLTNGANTFDFSGVSGFTLNQTLNGLPGTNFNSIIQSGGNQGGTGSFADDGGGGGGGGGGGVPEPSSLLLWSIVGMVGLCFGCRNLRGRLAV